MPTPSAPSRTLFAPALAFVDLETTGTRAMVDRITEVGVVTVRQHPSGAIEVDEWSSLVDPGVPIPPVIQALTGITDAMVRLAPTFSSVASVVRERLEGCVFIAHNARFDFGFLKQEFARLGLDFKAKVLCTVKLSRRLHPEADGHGLDALIARHGLHCPDRHRALGDARALWMFLQCLYGSEPAEAIEQATRRILRIPSLPPQLAPDALEGIPEAPGVYRFYGDNPLPLYIGKSINLRERVAAHFCTDWQRETDQRLAQEIRRIEWERTAGELGALLREAVLVKSLMPAHNHALRRKAEAGVMAFDEDGSPRYFAAGALEPHELAGRFGPFASKRGMRETLRSLAAQHGLCPGRLGLERHGDGPCFSRQVRRCKGACVGEESASEHDARLCDALAPLRIPDWPFEGPAWLREADPEGNAEVHLFEHWCWRGSARDDGEFAQLCASPLRGAFDLDVARLLIGRWNKRALPLTPVQARSLEVEASWP